MFNFKFRRKVIDPPKQVFENQPDGTEGIISMNSIIIPPEYDKTKPLRWKMCRCARLFLELGHLDKPITVIVESNERGKTKKYVLVDGYSRYIFCQLRKWKYIPVKYMDINDYIEK